MNVKLKKHSAISFRLFAVFSVLAVAQPSFGWEQDSTQSPGEDSLSTIVNLVQEVGEFTALDTSGSQPAAPAQVVKGAANPTNPGEAKPDDLSSSAKPDVKASVTPTGTTQTAAAAKKAEPEAERPSTGEAEEGGEAPKSSAVTLGNLKSLISSGNEVSNPYGIPPLTTSFLKDKYLASGDSKNRDREANKKGDKTAAISKVDRTGLTPSSNYNGAFSPGDSASAGVAEVGSGLTAANDATDSWGTIQNRVGEQAEQQKKEKEEENQKAKLDPDSKEKLSEIAKVTPHTTAQLNELVNMMNGDPTNLRGNTDYANTLNEVFQSVRYNSSLDEATRDLAQQYLDQNSLLITNVPRAHSNSGAFNHN